MTNNNPQLFARYTVVTDPNNRGRYSYHGEWKEFRNKQIKLQFIDSGEMREQSQTLRLTEWGPMLPLRNEAALVEPLGNFAAIEQAVEMLRADDVQQFHRALNRRGLSMWNFVFADVRGSIAYQYNATLRKRDTSFDWLKPVPGDDPRTRLGELWQLQELPNIVNPPSGLLLNCNNSPQATPVGPGIGGQWPPYISTYGTNTRYALLAELLQNDGKIDATEAMRYATDTRVPFAGTAIAALAKSSADSAAIDVLRKWDGRADQTSVGTVLYLYWISQDPAMGVLARDSQQGWSAANTAAAGEALNKAAQALRADFGRLDVRWGEFMRMRRGEREVGVAGYGGIVPNSYAAVNPTGPSRGSRQVKGPMTAGRGSSFRMVISLQPNGIRSWSVLPYGNSHDPKSPHYADQMSLFASGRYKETNFGLANARRFASQKISLR